MKQVYEDITPGIGYLEQGICQLFLLPIDFVQANDQLPKGDYRTGIITSDVLPIDGKKWLTLELIENTYKYTDTAASDKGGDYRTVSITGTSNYLDAALRQQLETLIPYRLLIITKDAKGSNRLLGTQQYGAKITHVHTIDNTQDTEQVAVTLSYQPLKSPPFYTGAMPV